MYSPCLMYIILLTFWRYRLTCNNPSKDHANKKKNNGTSTVTLFRNLVKALQHWEHFDCWARIKGVSSDSRGASLPKSELSDSLSVSSLEIFVELIDKTEKKDSNIELLEPVTAS